MTNPVRGSTPDPSRVLAIFVAARALPVDRREAFVLQQAGADSVLADEVLALLRDADVGGSSKMFAAGQAAMANLADELGAGQAQIAPSTEDLQSTATGELLRRLTEAPKLDTNRYEFEDQVGKGGMGVVMQIFDRHLNRRLAMKVMQQSHARGAESPRGTQRLLGRFLEEAQVTSQLDHPGVVPVHELGLDQDGKVYFTMRLVKGRTAAEIFALARSQKEDWTTTRAMEVILKVCDTMSYAHARGVLHRDLKPSNVMVGRFGEVYVMDWGLAKVLSRAGEQRARDAVDADAQVETVRQRDAEQDRDGPMASVAGLVKGTKEYMPPEQMRGETLDQRADIYSIGAMLYELLAGVPPNTGAQIVRDVLAGPPKRVEVLQPGVPAELVAIVEKAMQRDREQRYRSVLDLAGDLRAFLDQRSVKAYRTGALVELKLWVRRNKPLAASLAAAVLILVAGVVGTMVYADRADAKVREFDLLAGVVLHKRAIENEKDLYPPWPHKVEAMERWLKEDAGKLLAMQQEIERTVRGLEAWAIPPTAEQMDADRRSHPRFAEFEVLQKRVASLRYAQAITAGTAQLVTKELSAEQQALDVQELNSLAWDRVAPKPEERKVWGEEALGRALASAAAAKAKGSPTEFQILNTLAWALVANGQDAEAKQASARAYDLAPTAEAARYEDFLNDVKAACAQSAEILATADLQLAELTTAISERSFRFELESQRFLHDTLTELLGDLASLAKKEKAAVDQRLFWAKQIQQLSLAHPNANTKHTWAAVRAAIAANPKYEGRTIELREQDITGLVPIGENPVTHLWEFYELRSAWDGDRAPIDLAIPAHEHDGSIKVTGDLGIVFVLLPGGPFLMGAQKRNRDAPNYDPDAGDDESPDEVTLAPFFLARHEMTRAQWQRLAGDQLTGWKEGSRYKGDSIAIGATHPADSMDWDTADRWMRRHGMELPTEAQWEYGCRGGTTTVWWPGSAAKDLQGCANMHDQSSFERYPHLGEPAPIRDGFCAISSVGSFGANKFGLYDVHGNVWEWCRDWYGSYAAAVRAEDGYLLVGPSSGNRVYRGGSYDNGPSDTRSALRHRKAASFRSNALGLRPVRPIRVSP